MPDVIQFYRVREAVRRTCQSAAPPWIKHPETGPAFNRMEDGSWRILPLPSEPAVSRSCRRPEKRRLSGKCILSRRVGANTGPLKSRVSTAVSHPKLTTVGECESDVTKISLEVFSSCPCDGLAVLNRISWRCEATANEGGIHRCRCHPPSPS